MLAPWVLFLRVMIVTSSMPALAWTAVPALTPVPTALSAPLNNRARKTTKRVTGECRSLFLLRKRGLQQPVDKPARSRISEGRIPSLDKGKHACQRVFPALFALFALVGVSPPASQKPKITRKSIAGRCEAVLPEQKCVQTRKDPQRILAVLSRGLTQYGRISARQNRVCPCQSMVV